MAGRADKLKSLGAVVTLSLIFAAPGVLFGRDVVPAKPKAASPAKPAAPKKSASAKKPAPKKKTVARARRPRVQTAPTRDRIVEIQSALANAGAYEGTRTGKWDAATIQAMKQFQSANGLTPTGKINALTLQELGLGSEIAGRAAPLPQPAASAAGNSGTASP